MLKKKSILVIVLLIFFSSYITGFGVPEQNNNWIEFFQKAGNEKIVLEEETIYFPAINEENLEEVRIVARFGAYAPTFSNAVGCVPPAGGGDTTCRPSILPNYASILMKGVNVFINSTASDNDSEPLRLYVCGIPSASSSGCTFAPYCSTIQGGESGYSANPFCTINTSAFNEGGYNWWAFIFDSGTSNNAALNNPIQGNFVIDTTPPVIQITSLEGDTSSPYIDPIINDALTTGCDTTLVINPGNAKTCRWSNNVGDSFPNMPNSCSLASIDPLLVAAWGFDEDTTSGVSVPSLNAGGTAYFVGGNPYPVRNISNVHKRLGAGSYLFSATGNDYVGASSGFNMHNISPSGSYTIMAWVKPISIPNNGSSCGVDPADCHYKIAGKQTQSIGLKYGYNQLFDARICNDALTCRSAVSTVAYPINVWHHVAMTVDMSTRQMKLYVDGSQTGSTVFFFDWTALYNNSTQAFRVGQNKTSHTTSEGYPFDGYIDEVKFYQKALTAGEINNIRIVESFGISLQYNTAVCELDSVGFMVCNGGWTNNALNTAYFACADGVQDGTGDGIIIPTIGNFSGSSPIEFCIGTCFSPASAPLNLQVDYYSTYALNSGQGAVKLRWSDTSGNETGFKIEKSTNGSPFSWLTSTDPNVEVYANVGIADNTTFQYRIKSTNALGDSVATNVSGAVTLDRTPPDTPVVSTVPNAGSNSIDISWTQRDESSEWPHTQEINRANIVGSWSFEANTGSTVYDNSGNRNTGAITGAVWTTLGKVGNALSFNGSGQIVDIAADPAFNFTGDYTLEAWIKPSTVSGRQGIMGKKSANGWGLNLSSTGKVNFGSHSCSNFDGSTTLVVGQWYHVVGVFKASGDDEIYVNGVNDTPGSNNLSGGNCNNDTSSVVIGRYRADTTDDFSGLIDEVRIYNAALTAAQIATNYKKDSLIGYWRLENGSLVDSSSLRNNGTAVGGINCSNDPGKMGDGCTFGVSGQYVDIGAVNNDDNPDAGTVAAWVYPTSTGSNRYVVNGFQNNRTYLQWHGGNFRACMGDPGTCFTLKASAPLNEWQHLALTWENGDTLKGYYNGQLIGTQPFTRSADNSGFKIGSQGSGKEFIGNIDEVMIFDSTLSGADVQELYDAGTKYSIVNCISGGSCTSAFNPGIEPDVLTTSASTTALGLQEGIQYCFTVYIFDDQGNASSTSAQKCDTIPITNQAPVINNLYAIGSGAPCDAAAFNTTNTSQFSFTPGVDYLCVVLDLNDPEGNDTIELTNSNVLTWSAPGTEADALAGDGWNHHKNFSFVECDGSGTPKLSLGEFETKLCAQLNPSTDNTSSTGIGVKDVSGVLWEIKARIEDNAELSDSMSLSSIMNMAGVSGISNDNSSGCSFTGSPGAKIALDCTSTPLEKIVITHGGNVDLEASIKMTSDLILGPNSIDGTNLFWNDIQITDSDTLPGSAKSSLEVLSTIATLWNYGNTDPDTASEENTYLYISLPTDLMSGDYSGGTITYTVMVS